MLEQGQLRTEMFLILSHTMESESRCTSKAPRTVQLTAPLLKIGWNQSAPSWVFGRAIGDDPTTGSVVRMAAAFRPSANLWAALTLLGVAGLCIVGVCWWWVWPRIDYARHVGWTVEQPVPFSHQHHVAGLGIDCRFCHTSVETVVQCGHAADLYLHDVPFANLDQRGDSRAGATKPGR